MFFPLFDHRGLLGMNARNLLYIKPFNPRKVVAFADDKMKTKAFLSARGIPTARIFARIESRKQLQEFDFSSLPDECVLKPNYGFGGEGIILLEGRKNGQFLKQGKEPISDNELRDHIEDILDGNYSVNGQRDTAFFEQILRPHECFVPFRPAGLPDLRIVVFNLVPVMAMLRVPTAKSQGKANVHLGGIGIGIDIAKGITTHAAQYHHKLEEMPHGTPVAGIQIPGWEEILLIASRIQYFTNIGYLAVDLTIDEEMGPVLLEVNARAGLSVQIANLAPLRSRLERVGGLTVSSPEKGVRIAQELFGEKVGRRERAADERPILGSRESIEIAGDGFTIEEACAISPEQEQSVFTASLLGELNDKGAIEEAEGIPGAYKMKFTLSGKKIQTVVRTAEVVPAGVRAVIGRRDLSGFLIDPAKRSAPAAAQTSVRHDVRAADKLLCSIDKQISVLKELRPVNLAEELDRLRADESYNPVFLQRTPSVDLAEMEESIKKIDPDDSPLGLLLRKKKRELLAKIELVRLRGDAARFTSASLALYGAPSPALIGFAQAHLRSRKASSINPPEEDLLTAEEAKEEFEKTVGSYGLHDWTVKIKASMVADCAVGGKTVFIREGAKFSKEHIASLIAHEIEIHVLTAENGSVQPYDIFGRGLANYLDTQEGLAVYSQTRVLSEHHEKRFSSAKNVLAVAFAMEHTFAETRRYLQEELGFRPEKALMKAVDVKRGFTRTDVPGAFTKALVYFRGYRAIEQFAKQGGDLRRLFIGKIAIEDLPILEKIEGLRPPLILPEWLRQKKEKKTKKTKVKEKDEKEE